MTASLELLVVGFVGDVIMTYAINPLEDAIRKKMKDMNNKEKEEKPRND